MHLLSTPDIQALLSRLPKIEPCYEKTDTNIPANYKFRVSISIGKKFYVWIQYDESGDAAFFMELNKDKKVSVVQRAEMGENSLLPFSKGTALFGTMYEHPSGRSVFLIEDVYYYCGIPVAKETFARKLGRMAHIVEKLGSVFPIWMRLPHITHTDSNTTSGYIEHHAQYRTGDRLAPYVNIVSVAGQNETISIPVCERPLMCDFTKPQFRLPTVFWVKPAVQFDIYNLYCHSKNGKNEVYCGVAGIQTYNTSVLLNTLFRKVRGNHNLDAIEESDDEDMFEDVRDTKWVNDMSSKIKMVCEFNTKLRKWVPLKRADNDAAVVCSHMMVH